MRSRLDLMTLHVNALYTHDEQGDILRVREPNGAIAPRLFVGFTKEGIVRRYRDDVDKQRRRKLDSVTVVVSDCGLFGSDCVEKFCSILDASTQDHSSGPAYSFPARLDTLKESTVLVTEANHEILLTHLPAWLPDVTQSAPLFARVVNDVAVAVCGSVRITEEANEAGVETAKEFRGRGYALEVVSAWATALRSYGIEPLYSTSWENLASRSVARKLGLVEFGSDLAIA